MKRVKIEGYVKSVAVLFGKLSFNGEYFLGSPLGGAGCTKYRLRGNK